MLVLYIIVSILFLSLRLSVFFASRVFYKTDIFVLSREVNIVIQDILYVQHESFFSYFSLVFSLPVVA